MSGSEFFTTIAQLAAALTGFSGIAVVFNRSPGGLSEFEAFRLLILLANSLAAMFLSLIPFAFFYMNWSDAAIWRTSSALMIVFELVFIPVIVRRTLRFLNQHRELFNIALLSFLLAGHVLNVFLQLLGAVGWNGGRGLSIFIFGLLWLLFHSAFQFGRILFVQPMSGGAVSGPPNSTR